MLTQLVFPRYIAKLAAVSALAWACAQDTNSDSSSSSPTLASETPIAASSVGATAKTDRVEQGTSSWSLVRMRQLYEHFGAADSLAAGSVLYFSGGDSLLTDLTGVQMLGLLPAEGKAPFLILAALGCQNCDMNKSVYIHSPSDGPLTGSRSERRFSFPGQLLDAGSIVETSRLFIGKCTSRNQSFVLWFYTTLLESGRWADTVFVAQVVNDSLHAGFAGQPAPTVETASGAVQVGHCMEVPGEQQHVEP